MAAKQPSEVTALKQSIRDQARGRRRAQPDQEAASEQIWARCAELDEYRTAETVMYYLDIRSEVRTRSQLALALRSDETVVVPYCVNGKLKLFKLHSLAELEAGEYGIWEPRRVLRSQLDRAVAAIQLDLIIVPGIAFDRHGRRLGYGRGYYDELLSRVRPNTAKVGLAYECQLFDELPAESHDVRLDMIVTEQRIYRS